MQLQQTLLSRILSEDSEAAKKVVSLLVRLGYFFCQIQVL